MSGILRNQELVPIEEGTYVEVASQIGVFNHLEHSAKTKARIWQLYNLQSQCR